MLTPPSHERLRAKLMSVGVKRKVSSSNICLGKLVRSWDAASRLGARELACQSNPDVAPICTCGGRRVTFDT